MTVLAKEICVDPYTDYVERVMTDDDAPDPLRVRERLTEVVAPARELKNQIQEENNNGNKSLSTDN